MATSGPNSAGAGATSGGAGNPWATPGNIVTSDNAKATSNTTSGTTPTENLLVTVFGFAVPAAATINGILVEVEKMETAGGSSVNDLTVQLLKNGTTPIGSNLATAAAWPTSDTYVSYGGASNLWGTTWTVAEVNASTFGIALSAQPLSGTAITDPAIDHVRITITYTVSVGGSFFIIDTSGSA